MMHTTLFKLKKVYKSPPLLSCNLLTHATKRQQQKKESVVALTKKPNSGELMSRNQNF